MLLPPNAGRSVLRQVHPAMIEKGKVLLTEIFDNRASSTLDGQNSSNLENDI